MSRIYPDQSNP
ncbi:hypothetical protein AZE42_13514 [Rhizopogon vesiculosus]|uniref:Uncharacterized protein n=1 Tax=Rhizopogon vesiculosus TaxID=180088 RepID=A0A1J8RBG8_9AGAM|nr:hypothetical protein AZE42_13514 [Rhizopogon vesiculosus]